MGQKISITEILKVDYRSYDDFRFTYFIDWCLKYGQERSLPLQSLACSKPLYEWYCSQWLGLVETSFKSDVKDYLAAGISDPQLYFDLISVYPDRIEYYYPSVILEVIQNKLKTPKTNEKIHQGRVGR